MIYYARGHVCGHYCGWGGYFNGKMTYTTMRLMMAYNSPLVVCSSIGLFYLFNNMQFASKWINWMSPSVLAIYLIHSNPSVFKNCFTPIVLGCGHNILLMILVFISISVVCIFVDKIRIFIEEFCFSLILLIKNKWLYLRK